MKKAVKQSTLNKVFNSFSIVLIVLTFCSIILCNYYNGMSVEISKDRYDLTFYANQLKNASSYLTREVRSYASTGEQTYYDNYWNEVNNLKNRDHALEKMDEIGLLSDEKQIIDSIMNTSNNLIPLEENAMSLVEQGDLVGAQAVLYGVDYMNGVNIVGDYTQNFLDKLDARTMQQQAQASAQTQVALYLSIAFMALLAVIQVFSMVFTSRRLVKPIIDIKNELEQLAQGDISHKFDMVPDTSEVGMLAYSIHNIKNFLNAVIGDISASLERLAHNDYDFKIDMEYIGEFVRIKESFSVILGNMNTTFGEVLRCANKVAKSSEKVANGAQTLAEGATEQASSVESLSNTITGLSEQVKAAAGHADHSMAVSTMAGEKLTAGNDEMKHLLTAMEEINQSSKRIENIIKTIDDIAFQTNILALNAAVEAARAGEAGKGFAVVADEVRNLANKSADAAKETNSLIESSINAVKQGTQIADSTAGTLEGVMSEAQKAISLTDEIKQKTFEQAASIERITQNVSQISSVVSSTAFTADQSAASSQELSALAQNLTAMLSGFKLKN